MCETKPRPMIVANWRKVIFQQLKPLFSTLGKAKRQFLWGLKRLRTKARDQAEPATISLPFMHHPKTIRETQAVIENKCLLQVTPVWFGEFYLVFVTCEEEEEEEEDRYQYGYLPASSHLLHVYFPTNLFPSMKSGK